MLTTEGEAFLAAIRKLPEPPDLPASLSGACSTCKLEFHWEGRCNHSGLSVISTNQTATRMVTVWENNNHSLRMFKSRRQACLRLQAPWWAS